MSRPFVRTLLLAALFALAGLAAAAPLRFADADEEARFRALAAELRCVMCQIQSLADSDAPIARDLRAQVLEMMREGRSDDEIEAYLVERYSDFVLYRPPMKPSTWLLWFGPALVLVGGAGGGLAARRRTITNTVAAPPTSTSAGPNQ